MELPDKRAAEIEAYVRAGWFGPEAEFVRVAATELIQRHRVELLERFMREGIEWVRIGFAKVAVRELAKQAGGRLNPGRQVWSCATIVSSRSA